MRRSALCVSLSFVLVLSASVTASFASASDDPAAPAPPAAPVSSGGPAPAAKAADPQGGVAPGQPQPTTPLAVHVGDADILLGGFLDATSVSRSTNTGNGLGTNFSNFPFTTTAAGAPNPTGNLSETRFSAQNSRISLQATTKVGDAAVKGYVEADFLGNTAQNLNVTSNSNALRMRLYWFQYQQGGFEFLAGQSWSFMTPNRTGLSPVPGDLFYSQDMDTNYQMGLTWGRTTQFRFIAHPSSTFAAGVSIENPQQYTGAAVLPAAFTTAEVDTGSGSSAVGSSSPTPNPYPDIIGKVAFDPTMGNTHQHIDAAFLVSGFKTFDAATNSTQSATGTGGSVNVILEPVHNFKVLALDYYSKGGGRYIANTAIPDFIVNPDFSMSLVKSWSGIYGTEITAGKVLLYGYYSIAKADQLTTLDANGKTIIGYGVPSSQSPNHKIQETTVGFIPTLYRDPKIGGLQIIFQYSYLTRNPFSVPVGTPSQAKVNMVYVDLRYILP